MDPRTRRLPKLWNGRLFSQIGGGEAVADHHVVAFENLGDHRGRRVGRVRVVAVSHHVHVRVDVLEHGADHVALALPWRGSLRTTAPPAAAISAVRSVELLSYTYTTASGSAARKSRTTLPIVTSSL